MTQTCGRVRQLRELLAPAQVLGRDERVQQLLEEVELRAVAEDDRADALAVDDSVVVEHALAQLADDRLLHVRVVARRRWWTISSLETVAAPAFWNA